MNDENELLDIVSKLFDKYGRGKHWEVVRAEKTGHYEEETNGWNLTIQLAKNDDGGAENESN